ncbi:hypothetical protein [Kordiimonas sp.]|uniref:hypothetical protein n=1 Tax=Kordiimonas sp. TaxID=1970157 RepID=UPI003A95B3E6
MSSRKQSSGKKYRNKYEAADEFSAGVKKSLFSESPDGFDWDAASGMFMQGYEWGRVRKGDYIAQLNAALESEGEDTMGIVTVCNAADHAMPPDSFDDAVKRQKAVRYLLVNDPVVRNIAERSRRSLVESVLLGAEHGGLLEERIAETAQQMDVSDAERRSGHKPADVSPDLSTTESELLTALRAIAKHQEIVGGSMAKMSTTCVIATRAIEAAGFSVDGESEEQEK